MSLWGNSQWWTGYCFHFPLNCIMYIFFPQYICRHFLFISIYFLPCSLLQYGHFLILFIDNNSVNKWAGREEEHHLHPENSTVHGVAFTVCKVSQIIMFLSSCKKTLQPSKKTSLWHYCIVSNFEGKITGTTLGEAIVSISLAATTVFCEDVWQWSLNSMLGEHINRLKSSCALCHYSRLHARSENVMRLWTEQNYYYTQQLGIQTASHHFSLFTFCWKFSLVPSFRRFIFLKSDFGTPLMFVDALLAALPDPRANFSEYAPL